MLKLFKIVQNLLKDKKRETESKRNKVPDVDWAYLGGEIHTLEAILKLIQQQVTDQQYEIDKLLDNETIYCRRKYTRSGEVEQVE